MIGERRLASGLMRIASIGKQENAIGRLLPNSEQQSVQWSKHLTLKKTSLRVVSEHASR